MSTDLQLTPHNAQAEKATLGAMMLDSDQVDVVSEIIQPEMHYAWGHVQIHRAIVDLHSRGVAPDPVAVRAELQERGVWQEMGGDATATALLWEIVDLLPHANHGNHYAKLVFREWFRRAVLKVSETMGEQARDQSRDIDEIATIAQQELTKLAEAVHRPQATTVGDVLKELRESIQSGKAPATATGFVDLDNTIGGLKPGTLTILAARPSVGKTALAGNIALKTAQAGDAVLIFSLEQSAVELVERLLCGHLRLNSDRLRSPNPDEWETHAIDEGMQELSRLPLHIEDRNDRNVQQIRAISRIRRQRDNVKLIIVDYAQLIPPVDRKAPREQQVGEISRELKRLAKDLSVPVVALAQLNRSVEARENKQPRLSDLRESGSLEQDADVVMFLSRSLDPHGEAPPSDAKLIIAKNRNGPRGVVRLYFDERHTTFRNLSNEPEPY